MAPWLLNVHFCAFAPRHAMSHRRAITPIASCIAPPRHASCCPDPTRNNLRAPRARSAAQRSEVALTDRGHNHQACIKPASNPLLLSRLRPTLAFALRRIPLSLPARATWCAAARVARVAMWCATWRATWRAAWRAARHVARRAALATLARSLAVASTLAFRRAHYREDDRWGLRDICVITE